ncbi:MAG: LolA family protein [Planctomycetota bacterium]|jgi:outer membrane lipoprotein-sorting protein
MSKKTITKAIFILVWATGICWASRCTETIETQQQKDPRIDPLDAVLEQLNKKTSELKSYEGQIEYKFIQPLLESEALRKGVLHYARFGGKSALRINFATLKQEDEKEQKYIEQYIVVEGARLTHPNYQFKGIWLVHIDYEIEEVKYYQVAEPNDPNKPADVFDLASKNLPMPGFTKIEDLKKQFEVKLVEQKKTELEDFTQVNLKVKPNSIYKDDYISIDFWIDKKVGLPAKVVAVTTDPEPPFGDIYEMRFLKPKVNKGIDKKVFEFRVPKGFGEPEIVPLKK